MYKNKLLLSVSFLFFLSLSYALSASAPHIHFNLSLKNYLHPDYDFSLTTVFFPLVSGNIVEMFPQVVGMDQSNDSVRLLQDILASNPSFLTESGKSGIFDATTSVALRNFQTSIGLEETGTFSLNTRNVLNQTLQKYPFERYKNSFLRNTTIRYFMQEIVVELVLPNQINNGKVVVNSPLRVSTTSPLTDVATLQRVLRTDRRISYGVRLTGLIDRSTFQATHKLLRRYRLQLGGPASNISNINHINLLYGATTTQILSSILAVNNSSSIRPDLLRLPIVSPKLLVSNSIRTVSGITVTRNYRSDNTNVVVRYKDGTTETFILTITAPKAQVEREIARKLGRTDVELTGLFTHRTAYGRDFRRIVLTVNGYDEMKLDLGYADGFATTTKITSRHIDGFVKLIYGNDRRAYEEDVRDNLIKARAGEDISTGINKAIARFLFIDENTVDRLLTIDVAASATDLGDGSSDPDPCAGGGCGG